MNLPKLSVNRPVTVTMVILIILLLGFVSFTNLGIDLFPEMNLPITIIMTEYPGAGPAEVENLITRPLEQMIGSVGGLKGMESISMVGSSLIIAEFGWKVDLDQATLDLREQIDMLKRYLPAESENPMVMKMDPNLMPILQMVVTSELPSAELKTILNDKIAPRFERLEGVASVGMIGGDTREIRVEVDPAKLAYYDLTLPQIIQSVQGDNANLSSGTTSMGNQELLVRIRGEFQSLDDIGNVSLATPVGTMIRLKDLGEIKDTYEEVDKISRLNGLDSIGLYIQKQTDANTVQVSRAVRETLEKLGQELHEDMEITILWDQADYIELSIRNMSQNMLIGALLAMLILYIFLRNVRSTLVIALSMPISIIATFIMVYFSGINLNIMSLGGLALGMGMMVDNSIVILENIFRHREAGMEGEEASIFGANEVKMAITASTLTTVAVFFPIVFVEGIASQLFRELALSVSFALAASLLIALTLVPMLAARMLKVSTLDTNGVANGAKLKQDSWRYRVMATWGRMLKRLEKGYRKLLIASLKRRRRVILFVTLIVIGSVALIPVIGAEFIPAMDEGQAAVSISLPYGSKLAETERITSQVEQIVADIPEVELIFSTIGAAGDGMDFGGGSTENANVDLILKNLKERERATWEVADEIREKVQDIAGAEIKVSAGDASASMGAAMTPVQIRVEGEDLSVLMEVAQQVKEIIVSVPGTREVEISREDGRPELQVIVDRVKAAQYGLNPAQIASTVRAGMQGQLVTRYREAGEEIDVKVVLPKEYRESVADLKSMELLSPFGHKVSLGEVAELKMTQGPSDIGRRNQNRYISIGSQVSGRDLKSVVSDIQLKIDQELNLPDGYQVDLGGAGEEMANAFGSLTTALLLAIALVYMIMAAQFESFLHPFVIMFSMPVTIVGVVLGLLLTGRTLNVISFIGIIMLAGIVVNNAIVLVDYINTLRQRGIERSEAILIAGQTRLRPILMTALTTILAMLPLMFEMGEGGEAGAPMATAIVGGLTTSTILTLILVPVVYSIVDDWGQRFATRKARKKTGQEIEIEIGG